MFDDIDLSMGSMGNAKMTVGYKFTNSCLACPTALTAACQCQGSVNVCGTSTAAGCQIICEPPE